MELLNIPVPEIYKSSEDFRFFLKWFSLALAKTKYDTERFLDLYDPLRCKSELLWLLAWTMGFKYDDRDGLNVAYNRLILLYFMSMIRLKGSKDGVTLAAEVNLAQFNVLDKANKGYTDIDGNFVPPNDILNERLDDTSIPVNSVYVTPHTAEGYIDVVYFSTDVPIDACIEYVRPLGMYIFQYAGVRYDARTKIAVDARLTNTKDLGVSIGPTHVGHYRRDDYARMQRVDPSETAEVKSSDPNLQDKRHNVYYRNSYYEQTTDPEINPGYRAMYSLQLCNNENVFNSLIRDPEIKKIFNLGYNQDDFVVFHPAPNDPLEKKRGLWNLLYNQTNEAAMSDDVYTIDETRTSQYSDPTNNPRPAVNPIMSKIGEAMEVPVWDAATSTWKRNEKFTKDDGQGNLYIADISEYDPE